MMLRACKALLVTIAADVATVSSAVRSTVKADKQRSVIHVMHRISSLLESRGMAKAEVLGSLHALALHGITPGATDSMNEILTRVIGEIEQKVESKIKTGHTSTQAAIDEKVADLTAATASAVDEKKKADGLDLAWFQCVADEKAKRVDIENAEEYLKEAQQAQIAPCKLQEDRAYFLTNPNPDKYKMVCDFNEDTCDTNLKSWEAQVEALVSSTESGAKDAVASWTEAKNACDAAKANVAAAETALEDANQAWSAQRSKCLAAHESRTVAMCLFGAQLQRKCETSAAYSELITEVDGNGGEHSHSDRVYEWEGTAVTKCMLQKVIEGTEIDSAALDACHQSVNFDRDVGVLDKKGSTFEDLTSPAKFTCEESTIAFYGQAWEVPEGDAPHSSEYVIKAFAPAVSLATDAAPFAFCDA